MQALVKLWVVSSFLFECVKEMSLSLNDIMFAFISHPGCMYKLSMQSF